MQQPESDLTYWVLISSTMHFIAFVGVCLHALKRRRNASATILWIAVAWSFPFIGPLLYLSFGIDRLPDKGLRKKLANELMAKQRDTWHRKESSPFIAWHFDHRTKVASIEDHLTRRLSTSLDGLNLEHPMIDGNAIEPLVSGDQAYPQMLEAIRKAKNHIHVQSFIINRDAIGREFLEALKAKAQEGVKVRLLFDRFGSTYAYLSGMFTAYRKVPNFEICGWTQANPFKAQFQINLRNHRKCLVVDGKIAFFGGVNISCDNITARDRQAIRDYHFNVEGPFVHELQYSFLCDWFFMTGEPLTSLLSKNHFPNVGTKGTARARLLDSGPSAPPELIGEAFFNTIIMAEKQLLVVTPYFVPTNDLLKALRSAARRGVDVRIVLPEKNNHRYAGMASKALYEELLEAGVRIFQRKPPFIHAKAMIADDSIAIVGTANLDVRSLELNYETTVLISDAESIGKLKMILHEDINLSREIILNEWIKRPSIQKLGENLCSLMAPVL